MRDAMTTNQTAAVDYASQLPIKNVLTRAAADILVGPRANADEKSASLYSIHTDLACLLLMASDELETRRQTGRGRMIPHECLVAAMREYVKNHEG
jgi:hypothetical protein